MHNGNDTMRLDYEPERWSTERNTKNLEDILARTSINRIVDFNKGVYKPIDSSKNGIYDQKTFVRAMDDIYDLERYTQQIIERPNDPTVLSDIGSLLHREQSFYEKMINPAGVARVELDRAYEHGIEGIARYVEKRSDEFFDRFGAKDYITLANSLPFYKTGNDEVHDRFVEILNEQRKVREAGEDISKKRNYIKERMRNAPLWLQESSSYLMDREDYVSELFNTYAVEVEKAVNSEIYTKDRKLNARKIKDLFRDSLEEAQRRYNEEPDKGKKKDIWENDIRPYFVTLAKIIRTAERNEYKYLKDPDREVRKKERRLVGMS